MEFKPSEWPISTLAHSFLLQVDPATFQLSPGGSRRVTALQNGVPTDDVDIRTSNPDIAHAAGDRILHGTSGNVFVIVTAHSDTTSIGFASAIMLR